MEGWAQMQTYDIYIIYIHFKKKVKVEYSLEIPNTIVHKLSVDY